jgi:hypothetical protein
MQRALCPGAYASAARATVVQCALPLLRWPALSSRLTTAPPTFALLLLSLLKGPCLVLVIE